MTVVARRAVATAKLFIVNDWMDGCLFNNEGLVTVRLGISQYMKRGGCKPAVKNVSEAPVGRVSEAVSDENEFCEFCCHR